MQLLAAIQTLGGILQLLTELSDTAGSANGAKLGAVLNAIRTLATQAMAVSNMISRAMQEGRDELTDSERDEIRKMDDAARQAQVAAIAAASDESGDLVAQAEAQRQARRPGASKLVAGREPKAGERSLDDAVHGRGDPKLKP